MELPAIVERSQSRSQPRRSPRIRCPRIENGCILQELGIGAFATVSFQSEIIERVIWKTRRLFAPPLIEAIPRDRNVHDVLAVDALSPSGRGSGRDEKRNQVLLSRVAESSGWSA